MARPSGGSDDAEKEVKITIFLNFLETNTLLNSLVIMKLLQKIYLGKRTGENEAQLIK